MSAPEVVTRNQSVSLAPAAPIDEADVSRAYARALKALECVPAAFVSLSGIESPGDEHERTLQYLRDTIETAAKVVRLTLGALS